MREKVATVHMDTKQLAFENDPPTRKPKTAELPAVLYREYVLLARNRISLVLGITPMLVYLLLVNTSLSNFIGTIEYLGTELPYAVFMLPMVLAMSIINAAVTSGMGMFQEEISGVSTQIWSYPLRRSRYLIGKLLAGVLLVLGQTLLGLGLGVIMFNFRFTAEGWFGLLATMLLAAVAFNGIYVAAAVTITDFQTFMALSNISLPVLVFSAPALYTTESMPTVLQWISVINPVTYVINGMRNSAVVGLSEAWPSMLVLLGIAIVTYWIAGVSMLKRARNL